MPRLPLIAFLLLCALATVPLTGLVSPDAQPTQRASEEAQPASDGQRASDGQAASDSQPASEAQPASGSQAASDGQAAPASRASFGGGATLADSLATDADGDSQVDPGDVIQYDATLTNTDGSAATGVQYSATLDPNTTLVAGSITVTPIAVDDAYAATVGSPRVVPAASGVLANDTDPDGNLPLTAVAFSATSASGGTVVGAADGGFTYTSPGGFTGPDTFTYTARDSGGLDSVVTGTVTVTVAVNAAPTLDAIADPAAILEDAAQQAVNLTGISAGAGESQTLTVTATSDDTSVIPDPTVTYTSPDATGTVNYTPVADASGSATITVTVMDDGGTGAGGVDMVTRQFTVTVTAVNDAPSFTAGANQVVNEDAGAQVVPGHATAISAGPPDEAGQTVSFNVSNDNTGLFAAQPAIDGSGQLTYTPAPNASGAATVTVTAMDDGGTATGGVDTSAAQMFTITVTPVNDPPTGTADAYDFVGNTELLVDRASTGRPEILVSTTGGTTPAADGVLDNDSDPVEMSALSVAGIVGCADATAPFTDCATANGGAVTMEANGQFSFVPLAGDAAATDTFQYQLSDGTPPAVNVTVTLTRMNEIWYVENDNASGTDDGTSRDPFDTLIEAQVRAGAGDTIFILEGDGTPTGLGAFVLDDDDQRLIGEGVALTVPDTVNGVTGPTLLPAGSFPSLDNAVTHGVFITDADGAVVRGLNIGGQSAGIALDYSTGTNAVTIEDVTIGAGAVGSVPQGIVGTSAALTGGTLNLTINRATGIRADNTGILLDGSAAGFTLNILGFSGNAVDEATTGKGIVITGATFDAAPVAAGGDADFTGDTVDWGDTDVGDTTTPAGIGTVGGAADEGILLTGVTGDITFSALDVATDDGTAVQVVNAGGAAFDAAAGTGFRITFPAGSTLDAIGGAALDLDPVDVAGTVTTANAAGGVNGVNLENVTGSLAIAGGSITGTTGSAFDVSGGSPTVTYSGDIVNAAGRLIQIADTTAGTITFDGSSLSDSGAGGDTGTGIRLNNVAGNVTISATTTTIASSDDDGIEISGTTTGIISIDDVTITDAINVGIDVDGGGADAITATIDLDNVDVDQSPGGAPLQIVGMGGGSFDMDAASSLTVGAGTNASGVIATSNGGGSITVGAATMALNTGTANAVSLTSNSGATISFTGGNLDVDTTSGTGLLVSVGGTVNVTGASNTIVTTTGQAVVMSGVTLGASDVTFQSITTGTVASANGALDFDNVSNAGTFVVSGTTTVGGSAGDGINISGGTATFTLGGVNIDNRGSRGIDIDGASGAITFGATTVDNQTSSTAAGVDIRNTAGGSVTFSSLTVDNNGASAAGLSLASNMGTVDVQGGSVTGAAGVAVDVNAGDASTTIGATITNTAGRSVEVTNRTGGTVTFTASIDDDGTGIFLDTNGTGTVTFRGGMSLDTGANPAFTATGSGTVNVCATGDCGGGAAVVNTIGTSGTPISGTGVNIANTTIGASGVTFRSVNVNGAANGIVLDTTGSGDFTVTGNGGTCTAAVPTCTGGRIQSTAGSDGAVAGNGVHLDTTDRVSLSFMRIDGHPNHAIFGDTVTGFALIDSLVDGSNGTNDSLDEGSVSFVDLLGSAEITRSQISGGHEDNLRVVNSTGSLNRLVITDGIFRDNSNALGNDGILIESRSSSTMNVTVTGSTFTAHRGDHFDANATDTSTMDVVFTGNTLTGGHPSPLGQTVILSNGASADVTFDVSNNGIDGAILSAFTFFQSAASTASSSLVGTFDDNRIGTTGNAGSGSTQGHGAVINAAGSGTVTISADNNTIRQWSNEHGMLVQAGDGSPTVNVTVANNTIKEPNTASFPTNGLHLNAGTTAAGAASVCLDVGGNDMVGAGAFGADDFRLRQRNNSTVNLPGYAGGSADTAAVVTFVQGNNTGTPTGSASVSGSGGGFTGTGTTCTTPPLRAAGGEAPSVVNPASLTTASVSTLTPAAAADWSALTTLASSRDSLGAVEVSVIDLPDGMLGRANGTTIELDATAAGWGWFVDPTPEDASDVPADRIDLLTVLAHEMGHVLGRPDLPADLHAHDVMTATLETGVRRLPGGATAAPSPTGAANAPAGGQTSAGAREPSAPPASPTPGQPTRSGETVAVALGTIPEGKAVRVTYRATVDVSIPPGDPSVSSQGTVSGSNVAAVVTDDPATATPNDATLTPLDNPFDTVTLTLEATGSGVGTVTSSPGGIACGTDCAEAYTIGTTVTLTAVPRADAAFAGWSGPPDCADGMVTLGTGLACTAAFTRLPLGPAAVTAPVGDGAPAAPQPIQLGASLNLDGDAAGDVFVYAADTGPWARLLGDGAGNLSIETLDTWSPGWLIRAARFDADALTDFLLYNPVSGDWFKALNDGAGGFSFFSSTWSPGWQPYVLDLDDDGDSDVFLHDPVTGSWYRATNVGAGDFSYVFGSWDPNWEVYPVELNGDGRRDLFLHDARTGLYVLAVNDGVSGFSFTAGSWSPGWEVHPGDFDSNARSDLFLYNRTTGAWYVALFSGSGFAFTAGSWSPGWTVRIADFNADGFADVFVYAEATGAWFMELNDGAGGFTDHPGTWSPGWEVYVIEANGDAASDLLLYEPISGARFVMVTTGPGTFTAGAGSFDPGATVVAEMPRAP